MKLFINDRETTASVVRIYYTTEEVVTSPTPEPTPEPTPAPDQPCGPTPSNVVLSGSFDLANFGSQKKIDLTTQTHAFSFVVKSSPSYGQFAIGSQVAGIGITRCAWLSLCPGGPAIAGSVIKGEENTSLRFSNSPRRGHVLLDFGKTYWLNVRNGTTTNPADPSTCSAGANCGIYMMLYSG